MSFPFMILTADENVLGHGQMAHHVQLLMHDDDACMPGRLGDLRILLPFPRR